MYLSVTVSGLHLFLAINFGFLVHLFCRKMANPETERQKEEKFEIDLMVRHIHQALVS